MTKVSKRAQQLITFLDKFHTWIVDQWHTGEISNEDFAWVIYKLGEIQGHLSCNKVFPEDLETIEVWEEAME